MRFIVNNDSRSAAQCCALARRLLRSLNANRSVNKPTQNSAKINSKIRLRLRLGLNALHRKQRFPFHFFQSERDEFANLVKFG